MVEPFSKKEMCWMVSIFTRMPVSTDYLPFRIGKLLIGTRVCKVQYHTFLQKGAISRKMMSVIACLLGLLYGYLDLHTEMAITYQVDLIIMEMSLNDKGRP